MGALGKVEKSLKDRAVIYELCYNTVVHQQEMTATADLPDRERLCSANSF